MSKTRSPYQPEKLGYLGLTNGQKPQLIRKRVEALGYQLTPQNDEGS